MLNSINPYSDEVIATYPQQTLDDAKVIVTQVSKTQQEWMTVPIATRTVHFARVAEILRAKAHILAMLITLEMGKPIKQAEAEVEKCAATCDYYAQNAAIFLTPQMIETPGHKSFICFDPIGVILSIMPWNFPFWQVFRAAIPALIAGNGMVLKHASSVSGCALTITHIFEDAGFPKHLFQTVLLDSQTTQSLIAEPLIQGVTMTGSTAAGRQVAAQAGRYLKSVFLNWVVVILILF